MMSQIADLDMYRVQIIFVITIIYPVHEKQISLSIVAINLVVLFKS